MKPTNDLEQLLRMLVSDDDLRKLDDERLEALSLEQLQALSKQLCRDLKEARDRMNQNPGNSSRPPSTQAPWESWGVSAGEKSKGETPNTGGDDHGTDVEPGKSSAGKDTTETTQQQQRRPGRQKGAQGHGRKLEMVVTGETVHRAHQCARCAASLEASAPFTATTGFYVVDIEVGAAESPGVRLSNTKHLYGETAAATVVT